MWRFLWLCRHHHHESIDEMQPAHTLGKHYWLLFCKVLHFPLTASRIREEVWNHYNQQLKKKRQKDRVHSFPNGNKMIERTSSGPLRLASKSDKIKKDKTLLPRCWGAISKNLEGDSKTYGQSMDFQSIHEIRYKMRPALRDQHEGSRLAYECRTPGKSRAKIKAHLLSEEEILHDIS